MLEKSYKWQSFEGQDLSKEDLSNRTFLFCNFNNCNLEKANCRYSDFGGSTMVGTNCRYTDFAYSKLGGVDFRPKDAYGVVFSLECSTFKSMKISLQWWLCYLFFAMLMVPEKDKEKDLKNELLFSVFGKERFLRLSKLFETRCW